MNRVIGWSACAIVAAAAAVAALNAQSPRPPRRNVLIFVADGLRHGSVNEQDTPALWAIRTQGVHFENSHSVFPTFTMANASVIATGHGLGDTGIYSNTIWPRFAMFDTGNFNLLPGTTVPFIENDRTLADLDDHFGGNILGSDTFLAIARAHGYRTATIGKLGPAALQDAAALTPRNHRFPDMLPGIIVDDATGNGAGFAWPAEFERQVIAAGIAAAAPTRSNGYGPTSPYNNGYGGDYARAGTIAANVVQQDWFVDLTTRVVLPWLTREPAAPFALLYWSRDPDGTQHNEGDSLGVLQPGINGPTTRRALRAVDGALQRLLAWLDAHPDIRANTDIVVTSDHGFATISRSEIEPARRTARESARHDYLGADGAIDTLTGMLPCGFLALDLAYDLKLNVFDPDQRVAGSTAFRKLRVGSSAAAVPSATWEHPISGNAMLATSVERSDGSDARLVIAANGGSDLIYIPDGDAQLLRQVVDRLLTYDYVSGLFVDDKYGAIPGTLPLSAIGLQGASKVPRPAIVVGFKFFYMKPGDLQSAVQISDSLLQEGQGMHGGFGRDSTFNNMAAAGPDFKRGFADAAPAGNIDIARTLVHVLGFDAANQRTWTGRVLAEALAGGPAAASPPLRYLRSAPANGTQTIIAYQEHGGVRYLQRGCFVAAGTADDDACR